MKGYIYKLTLNKDLESFKVGEIYIGKHNGRKPTYYSGGKVVKYIVDKYSQNVFNREILATDIDNNELLSYLEIYYIAKYNCNRSERGKGLNLTRGGEGICNYKRSEEYIAKVKNTILEQYKNGRKAPSSKLIHQYDLSTGDYIKSFNSLLEAADEVGCSNSAIAAVARGKYNMAGGYTWSYDKINKKLVSINRRLKVDKYDICDNYIETYSSITEAAKVNNISVSSVYLACKGQNKTGGGFKWKYNSN